MDTTSQSCSVEPLQTEDEIDDQTWPSSRFSKEERVKSLKNNIEKEAVAQFRPFSDIEADFPVDKRNIKWFPNEARHRNCEDRSVDLELHERLLSSRLITKLGELLRVNQVVINTAIVYLARFCSFHPVELFQRELTAAVALRLASKFHDVPRSYDSIKAAIAGIDSRNAPLPGDVDLVEDFFLATFGFDLEVEQLIVGLDVNLLDMLDRLNLLDTARNVANESLQITTFCIRYPTCLVNAFAIYLASQYKQCEIPMSRDGKPWYHFVNKNISLRMLNRMKDEFLSNKEAMSRSPKTLNCFSNVEAYQKNRSQKRGNDKLDYADSNHSKIARLSTGNLTSEKHVNVHSSMSGITQNRREKFITERHPHSVKVPFVRESLNRSFSNQANQDKTNSGQQSKAFPTKFQSQKDSPLNESWKKSFSVVPDKSFNFIKSTIPLKIHPLQKTKDQTKHDNINLIPEDLGNYTSAKPTKQRISHYRQQQDKAYEEPDIDQVSHVEEVWSSGESSLKSDQSSSGNSMTRNLNASLKPNKSRHKKQKHNLKRLSGDVLSQIRDKVSLKITIKKANDGTWKAQPKRPVDEAFSRSTTLN